MGQVKVEAFEQQPPVIQVSGAEPAVFFSLGQSSGVAEEYGADFFWESKLGKVGVQRKEFPGDFLSSMQDPSGRMNLELLKMQSLDVKVLMIEGEQRANWANSGELWDGRHPRRYTLTQHRNYLASIQLFRGLQVQRTKDKWDSMEFIKGFYHWTMADEHHALDYRPAAKTEGFWDTLSNEDYQKWFLQSLPLVGPKRAKAIIETLGFPFRMTLNSPNDLMEVPGIGGLLAQRIWDMFHKLEARNA